MAVWNETTLSKIGRYITLSADYYTPEFEKASYALEMVKSQVVQLRRLIKSRFPITYGVLKPRDVESGVFRLARIQNSESLFIFADDLPPISQIQFNEYARSEVRLGDIVLAIGGYIGPLGFISEADSLRININRHLARISADSELIDPYYLAAYLACDISQSLLRREIRGAVQAGINLADLKLHPVFVPSENDQKSIGDQMRYAEDFLRKARASYSEAQHLLEREIGFDKLKLKKLDGYTARFSTIDLSDALNSGRIDAQCFAPNAIFYESWLHNHAQCSRLSHLLEAIVKGRQQKENAKGSTDYCSIKHISGNELTEASKCYPAADTPLAVQENLLLAITGATIGKIGIVKRYKKLAFSGDLLCLRVNPELNPHYLLVVLDHVIGQVQFNRWITGSTNGHLAPRDVGRVLVPRLKKGIESRIAGLVEESLSKRIESEKLLDQAKTKVEQLIELAAAQ